MKKTTKLLNVLESQGGVQQSPGMITKYGCTPVKPGPLHPGMITKYGCTPVKPKPPRPGLTTRYGCAPVCVNQENR